MRSDGDPGAILLDYAFPPAKRLAADDAAGISNKRPATDFLRRFVDIAHHQEEQVADVFPR